MSFESKVTEEESRLREQVERTLGPEVLSLLKDPSVIEIMLNPDSRLWVERHGEKMRCVGEFPANRAESLIAVISSSLKTVCNEKNPILECELPYDGSRFEGLVPPVVARPTFVIRKKAEKIFPLSDYEVKKIITKEQHEVIKKVVASHENILVAGGTQSGKTTFTNAIIDEISKQFPDERLVIIQDTNELQSSAQNVVFLRSFDFVDMTALLKATLRLRPDRIIVGEVRDGSALALLKAWNTGHSGGAATIHCNGGEQSAFLRVEELCEEAVPSPKRSLIVESIGIVVFIKKDDEAPAGRKVKSIFKVERHDGEQYVVSHI